MASAGGFEPSPENSPPVPELEGGPNGLPPLPNRPPEAPDPPEPKAEPEWADEVGCPKRLPLAGAEVLAPKSPPPPPVDAPNRPPVAAVLEGGEVKSEDPPPEAAVDDPNSPPEL